MDNVLFKYVSFWPYYVEKSRKYFIDNHLKAFLFPEILFLLIAGRTSQKKPRLIFFSAAVKYRVIHLQLLRIVSVQNRLLLFESLTVISIDMVS